MFDYPVKDRIGRLFPDSSSRTFTITKNLRTFDQISNIVLFAKLVIAILINIHFHVLLYKASCTVHKERRNDGIS